MGKSQTKDNSLENPENLANLLVALSGKWETPALIAYLADERFRLLLCKALISPVSEYDRQLARRASRIQRFRGMDSEQLKKRLEPAAFALGLVSACDVQLDYYNVLGVKSSATPPELRAAYRKRAFELHPDTAQQTTENSTDFVTVKTAYDTLIDPNSRTAFDQCRVQLGSWYEEDPAGSPGKGAKRQPAGKLRKTCYRIAAVVAVMVVIAWVLNILYERETMLELVQVTSSTEPGPARKMTEPDPGEVENKAPVLSEVVEGKAVPKKSVREKPAPKKVVREPTPKKPVPKKPGPKKPGRGPLKTAVVAVAEPVEAREPVWAPEPIEEKKPSLDVKREGKGTTVVAAAGKLTLSEGAPEPEPVEARALPSTETAKTQAPVVRESRRKKPKDVLKPAKEKVIETPEVAKKKQPNPTAPVRPKSPEKPAESSVQQASIPSVSDSAPGTTVNVSATAQAQVPAVSEDPAPVNSSLQTGTDSSVHVFPDIPVPKTHKTPLVKHSQVLAFLKKYTEAYERGNAETFFSYFTANAMENGKPLKEVKPDYLEVWDKLQSLDYRISVDGTEQVIGSDMVSMAGRFRLDWKFFDGRSGQSHGEIFMDLKLNKSALRISRLNYRFDGE